MFTLKKKKKLFRGQRRAKLAMVFKSTLICVIAIIIAELVTINSVMNTEQKQKVAQLADKFQAALELHQKQQNDFIQCGQRILIELRTLDQIPTNV